MQRRLPQTLAKVLAFALLLVMALFFPSPSFADGSQNLLLGGNVVLQPGDVINFKGGGGAFLSTGEYGHTGMYLGSDPATGKKIFLDFTTNKPGSFRGRITGTERFLADNLRHGEFNVYRLDGRYPLNQQKLVESAKTIATNKNFGALIDCANAASRALSAATGVSIVMVTPDGFANDQRFTATSLSVDIKTALNEVRHEVRGVSGRWQGAYYYDDPARVGVSGAFSMDVQQQGSSISGSIVDAEAGSASFSGIFNAASGQIQFTKNYNTSGHNQIVYRGAVDSSGNTAAGRWSIGSYTGSWQMHR